MEASKIRFRVAVCVLVVAAASAPRPAQACSCVAGRPPCKEIAGTQAVFVGEVLDAGEIESEGGYVERLIRLRVLETFKGVLDETVEIVTGWGGGDCGFDFQMDERYVVYAYREEARSRLYAGICSNTRHLSGASMDLEFLRTWKDPARGSGIEGQVFVVRPDPGSNGAERAFPLPDAKVTVEGEGVWREVASDPTGAFRVWGLPEGDFTVSMPPQMDLAPLVPSVETRTSPESCGWVHFLAQPTRDPR